MKKKTLALLLSLTLAAGMIGGCGSKTETTTEENVQTAQTEAVAETETEAVSDQDTADHVAGFHWGVVEQVRPKTDNAFYSVAADKFLAHCAFLITEKDSVREQNSTSTGILFEACNNVLEKSIVGTALWRNT